MIEIWLLFVVIVSAVILVTLLDRKEQELRKGRIIKLQNDGNKIVKEALEKLEDARRTAAANQPK